MPKQKNVQVPKQLPDCDLMRELVKKSSERTDTKFDFIGELIRFKDRVTKEIQYINVLFPEYVPHDEQYHIRNLFYVADKLLGNNLLGSMNSSELFILACSLYGHDWGMAVSEQEKTSVVSQNQVGEADESLGMIPREHDRFILFAKERLLNVDEAKISGNLEIWRDYVRHTHHIRSGVRTRKFWEHTGLGIPEAVGRVCESHGYDCSLLTDSNSFPTSFPVIGESVNLRAIAIYLRLIDLFDLGDDRTPFVVWKFVWPRDPKSKMEWRKHRALQPITCIDYYPGRVIQIDGGTDDYEVYAALEDLRRYCEKELEECCGLMARMSDPRHKLNLTSPIQWRVAARGFKPVSIRFEFDRTRMFEILGSEIYQGDRHVFLRELLQNSVDAIRVRRAAFVRAGMAPPSNLGIIRVSLEAAESGECVVTWQDDGAGMDEYIVKNYLAVAGKSYYHSQEFKKMGLEIDPISHFGIGILSCFVVADRIEIETFKERYLPAPTKPIRVVIPAADRQFRVEELNEEGAQVGTEVKVFVQRKRLINHQTNEVEEFNVTDYLLKTAGFVEFPIAINEQGKKTLIVRPNQSLGTIAPHDVAGFKDYAIKQLNLTYPWSEVVWASDLEIAQANFREERFDLRDDLKLDDYEGVLVYPVPVDYRRHYGVTGGSLEVLSRLHDEGEKKRIRLLGIPHGSIRTEPHVWFTDVSERLLTDGIYRDGLRISKAMFSSEELAQTMFGPSLPQVLLVNLPKSRSRTLDVARTQILGDSQVWSRPIFDGWIKQLAERYQKSFEDLEPVDRLIQLVNFQLFHRIPLARLMDVLPIEAWPVPFVACRGLINVKSFAEVKDREILELPEPLETIGAFNVRRFFDGTGIEEPWGRWEGEECLCTFSAWAGEDESVAAHGIVTYVNWIRDNYFKQKGVRFLSPPWKGSPPLLQGVWEPLEGGNRPGRILSRNEITKLTENPSAAVESSLWRMCVGLILERSLTDLGLRGVPPTLPFPNGFGQYFAYGHEVLNAFHPATRALAELVSRVLLAESGGYLKTSPVNIRQLLATVLYRMPGSMGNTGNDGYTRWAQAVRELKAIIQKEGILAKEELDCLPPLEAEFVPGSTESFLSTKVRKDWREPFGTIL